MALSQGLLGDGAPLLFRISLFLDYFVMVLPLSKVGMFPLCSAAFRLLREERALNSNSVIWGTNFVSLNDFGQVTLFQLDVTFLNCKTEGEGLAPCQKAHCGSEKLFSYDI